MKADAVLIFGTFFLILATGVCLAILLGQLRREKIQKLQKQGKRDGSKQSRPICYGIARVLHVTTPHG